MLGEVRDLNLTTYYTIFGVCRRLYNTNTHKQERTTVTTIKETSEKKACDGSDYLCFKA